MKRVGFGWQDFVSHPAFFPQIISVGARNIPKEGVGVIERIVDEWWTCNGPEYGLTTFAIYQLERVESSISNECSPGRQDH